MFATTPFQPFLLFYTSNFDVQSLYANCAEVRLTIKGMVSKHHDILFVGKYSKLIGWLLSSAIFTNEIIAHDETHLCIWCVQ